MNKKKCGFIALVGRANVGKSTLINACLGEKVSIVSDIPQTTRMKARAILTEERGQIIFVDNPGFCIAKEKLSKILSNTARDIDKDVDLILYVVDLQRVPGTEEKEIAAVIKNTNKPVIMALNKRDAGQKYANDYIELWNRLEPSGQGNLKFYVPLSALTKKGVKELLALLFQFLPEQPLLYPADIISDLPQKLAVADIVREKIFLLMKQEVPYSAAVFTEEITIRSPKLVYVNVTILVQRETQKAIIIGEKAVTLKKIGELARIDLQDFFGRKVYLEIWVKVKENWPNDHEMLKKLGILS